MRHEWVKACYVNLQLPTIRVKNLSTTIVAVDSGNSAAGILSAKATLVLGPWKQTELYLDVGSVTATTPVA